MTTCYCGSAETRPYACGPRCPVHTPAALAGQPEPDSRRYCAPARCYCDSETCTATSGPLEPITKTVLDARAVASGKRRAGLGEYRDAQAQVHGTRTGAA